MQCDKVSFRTKGEALARINQINREDRRAHRKPVRAYYCSICKNWHLTSKEKTERQVALEKYHPGWAKLLNRTNDNPYT